MCVCFFGATAPQWAKASSFTRFSRSHTLTHHSRYDSSGRVISSSQRPLPDNTQHSQQTDINAPGGIRTHNLSRGAAADLRLRPRDHWGQHLCLLGMNICLVVQTVQVTLFVEYLYTNAYAYQSFIYSPTDALMYLVF